MQNCSLIVRWMRPCVLSLLLVAPLAAQGHVFVVDDVAGPGVDFTTVNDAVAAAGEHDTIVVHAGEYFDADGVVIAGKSVAIVARSGDLVKLGTGLRIEELAGNQFVSLTGITIKNGLFLADNAGAVWIDNCDVEGKDVFDLSGQLPVGAGGPGMQVSNCANVSVMRSSVVGGFACCGDLNFGGHALVSEHSSVWASDTEFVGGGVFACDFCGWEQGRGLVLTAGEVSVDGSTVQGHFAVVFKALAPTLWVLDSTLTTLEHDQFGDLYPPVIGTGTVTTLDGPERDFTIDSPVHEQDTLTVSLDGVAGDSAWLFLGLKPGAVMAPQYHGPFLMSPANLLLSLAVLPPGGSLSIPATVPAFIPGIEALAVVMQAAFIDSDGDIYLSDAARLVMLAQEF